MKTEAKAQLLSVYIGETDRYHGGLLWDAIVFRFKELGLAGVTVLQGCEGYGIHRTVHIPRLENLFSGQPIVIEVIDTPDQINVAVAALDSMVVEGLATIHDVTSIRYAKDPKFGHHVL